MGKHFWHEQPTKNEVRFPNTVNTLAAIAALGGIAAGGAQAHETENAARTTEAASSLAHSFSELSIAHAAKSGEVPDQDGNPREAVHLDILRTEAPAAQGKADRGYTAQVLSSENQKSGVTIDIDPTTESGDVLLDSSLFQGSTEQVARVAVRSTLEDVFVTDEEKQNTHVSAVFDVGTITVTGRDGHIVNAVVDKSANDLPVQPPSIQVFESGPNAMRPTED